MFKLKTKKLLLVAIFAGSILFSLGGGYSSSVVYAGPLVDCKDGFRTAARDSTQAAYDTACANHKTGTSEADDVTAASSGDFKGDCTGKDINAKNCGILAYLLTFINLLSAVVGIVVVIMIAVGGIQYSASRDNPQATQAAKERIRNAIIALVAYLFMYAFLQYIIPGGVL